ncbi:MAG: hypothetical protein WEA82_06355, partial [Idiomarina sp.]
PGIIDTGDTPPAVEPQATTRSLMFHIRAEPAAAHLRLSWPCRQRRYLTCGRTAGYINSYKRGNVQTAFGNKQIVAIRPSYA